MKCIYKDEYIIDLTKFRKFNNKVRVSLCLYDDKIMYKLHKGSWKKLCDKLKNYCRKCSHPLEQNRCYAHNDSYEYLDRTIAVGLYYKSTLRYQGISNELSRLIYELKSDLAPAPILGAAIYFVLKHSIYDLSINDIDYLTYVPKTLDEYKIDHESEDHYNQSRVLAGVISSLSGLNIIDLFIKKRSLSMRGLRRDERYQKAIEVFDVNEGYCSIVSGKSIAIIDDTRTSGATGNTLAYKAKRICGVHKVYLVVAGRTYFTRYDIF